MKDKSYTVIIEEPTAKLYRITNPEIQMKPYDFTLVKQENGERQLISANKLYEAAGCDSMNTDYGFDYYVIKMKDNDSTISLAPAVPISLYLKPPQEETIKPTLQYTSDNKLRSSCSLREAINFFTTNQSSFSKSKLQGMITSTMLATNSIAEAGGAILNQNETRNFCNEYTNYPPFNLSANLTSDVFPTGGLLCVSVIDYCKTHTNLLSREYWGNYIKIISEKKSSMTGADSNTASQDNMKKNIGPDTGTISTSVDKPNTSGSDSSDSDSSSSDSSEDITLSTLQSTKITNKESNSLLELTDFAKSEKNRLSVMGCNQFDDTLNAPLYVNNMHYREENGVYYYTITGLVKVWKRHSAVDYDVTIEPRDIVRFIQNFDFRFTYTKSKVTASDDLAIQLLERYRANLLSYASVPGYDKSRFHDLSSLLIILYEILLYIMGADRYSVSVIEFITARLGCAFKLNSNRGRTIRDILPPYTSSIILHFENYSLDPQVLSKVLKMDMFAACRICTSLFCKRTGKNSQRFQLKAPVVKEGEAVKKRRGLQSIAARRSRS